MNYTRTIVTWRQETVNPPNFLFHAGIGDAFDGIPQELVDSPHWLPCNAHKAPWDVNRDNEALWTNPSCHMTFADAYRTLRTHDMMWVGYVFGFDDRFSCIDLDHVREPNGQFKPWTAEARAKFNKPDETPHPDDIVRFLNSYTEESVSGSGVHIVVESDEPLPRGQSRGTNGPDGMKLEIFKKKYVVMTGKIMGRRREIKKRTEKLQQLHALTVMERSAADPQPVDDAASDTRQVGDIVAECIGDYRNGRKFQTWHQYGAAAGDDRSAVDYGYACQIAAHTHDPALIEAVMRSGAMLRAKWDDRQHRGWLQEHCILPAIRATPLQETRSLRNGDGRLAERNRRWTRQTIPIHTPHDVSRTGSVDSTGQVPGFSCDGRVPVYDHWRPERNPEDHHRS